ncbi:MAG: hypothetical protein VX868_01835 [Chloroflexota bacterium]|nr:hypothetical protein [Chloroflexota bacterium]
MFKLTIVIIGIILTLLALYIAVIVSLILFDSEVAVKGFSEEINPMPFQHNQPPMPFQHNLMPMPFQHNLMPMTPGDWKGKELWYEKEKRDRRSSIEWTVEDFDKFISQLKLEQKILANQLEIETSHLELEIDYFTKQKNKLK